MNRFLSAVVIALAAIAVLVPCSLHSQQAPAVGASALRSLEFTYVVHVPALPPAIHAFRVWVPLPYEDSYQSVSALRIDAPVPHELRREPVYANRYAYFDFDAAKQKTPFDITLSFHATRREHRAALRSTAGVPGNSIDVARFLQPDRLVPIDGEIAELSQQATKGVSDPMQKARRIYDYVVATMHYDHHGSGWGRGDAVWACNAKHGNCTDFHSLFIGMARAASIPARFEIGFPLPANSNQGEIKSYHCWAEFYLDGTGWVPIDASEAWKNPAKKDYFFGATDANRVMFSLGRDIRLNPPEAGEPLNYFVYPYAEADGKTFTGLTNEISFRDDASTGMSSGAGMQ